LDRIVAVKLILFGAYADEASVRRFRAEAAAAAQLQHPNIVAIHEVGEQDGQQFFSMAYVNGPNLSKYAREEPITARHAARLLQTIATAIHYAHEHGIVHRDLKPSNILIDPTGEPCITDFGLAKRLTSDAELTVTGQVLGSPNYLPPEQASATRGPIGARTDIYALGAILYHLLTGRPPFAAETITDTLQQVMNIEPVSPRLLNPSVPKDLETICLKCLEKDAGRRYASAQALAQELNRFLHDEPIRARPIGAAARLWRWCRRKPALASLSGAVGVLLVTIALGSLWAALRVETARDVAVRERDRAERTVHELELQTAERFLGEGDSSSAVAILARMLRDEPTNRMAASWLMDMLGRFAYPLPQGPAMRESSLHARFSPDGKVVATVSPSGLRLWDAATGALRQHALASTTVLHVDFSPDGSKVACACLDGTARIVDVTSGRETARSMAHGSDPVWTARFSPDGSKVVTATRSRFARIWSAETGEPLTEKLMHSDEVNFAQFSPDGRRVLTASEDHTAMIWDVETGRALIPALRHEAEIWSARFSPDGTLVATVSRDRTARLWNAQTGQAASEPLRHLDFVEFLEFSPDGRLLVTCSYDKTARLWDTRTGVPRGVLRHTSKVNSASFSPDGTRLVTATSEGTAQVWNVASGEPAARAISHARRIWYAEFGPDGQSIVTTSSDGSARVWRIKDPPDPVRSLQHGSVIFDAEFAANGQSFATVAYDGTVRIWPRDAWAGAKPRTLPHPKGISDVQFSPDGTWLATLGRGALRLWNLRDLKSDARTPNPFSAFCVWFDAAGAGRLLVARSPQDASLWDFPSIRQIGTNYVCPAPIRRGAFTPDGKVAALSTTQDEIFFFDTQTGKPLGEPLRNTDHVGWMEFSPDNRYLLTIGKNPHARLWNLATRRLHVPPLQQSIEMVEARFDQQGNRIVTASADGTARVWDVHTGRPLTEPLNHRGKVTSVSFSPDGAHVLTGSVDGTARLWDARTGEPITAPLVHQGEVSSARFSPDGKLVITASRDGMVRLWSPMFVAGAIPGWLPDFAEAMAGKRVTDIRAFEFVPADAIEKMKDHLKSLPTDEPFAAWATRFFNP
jgi:WD40 repeat protein